MGNLWYLREREGGRWEGGREGGRERGREGEREGKREGGGECEGEMEKQEGVARRRREDGRAKVTVSMNTPHL